MLPRERRLPREHLLQCLARARVCEAVARAEGRRLDRKDRELRPEGRILLQAHRRRRLRLHRQHHRLIYRRRRRPLATGRIGGRERLLMWAPARDRQDRFAKRGGVDRRRGARGGLGARPAATQPSRPVIASTTIRNLITHVPRLGPPLVSSPRKQSTASLTRLPTCRTPRCWRSPSTRPRCRCRRGSSWRRCSRPYRHRPPT